VTIHGDGTDAEVTLTIGDTAVSGWEEVSITLDMLAPGSPWTLSLYESGQGHSYEELQRIALVRSTVTVKIDSVTVLAGVIERRRDGATRTDGSMLTLNGRDLAADAMASDAPPTETFRGLTLEDALRRLFLRVSTPITIVDAATARAQLAGNPRAPRRPTSTSRRQHVDLSKVQIGETVWQVADRLCRRHGFLLYTAPTGDGGLALILDRPRYDAPVEYLLARFRAADGVFWDGNIVDGARDLNAAEVPDQVTVFGHSGLTAPEDARHRGVVVNQRLAHPLVAPVANTSRERFLRDARARTPLLAEQRARRELAKANAGFEVYDARVGGFAYEGKLWTISAMCRLHDERLAIDADWLTTRVTFTRSRKNGTFTLVRLVPDGALVIEPDPEA